MLFSVCDYFLLFSRALRAVALSRQGDSEGWTEAERLASMAPQHLLDNEASAEQILSCLKTIFIDSQQCN